MFGRDIDRQKFCKYGWDSLFRKSSVVKECGGENLIVSRDKLAIDIFCKHEIIDAGTRIKWPRIRVLPPSLIASYISFAILLKN